MRDTSSRAVLFGIIPNGLFVHWPGDLESRKRRFALSAPVCDYADWPPDIFTSTITTRNVSKYSSAAASL